MAVFWSSIGKHRPRRAPWVMMLAVAMIGYVAIAAIRAIAQHPTATTTLSPRHDRPRVANNAVAAPAPDPTAAPGTGTTGTAALPIVPIPAAFAATPATDGTVHPAPPFSTLLATPVDRGRAIECLTAAIYYEAGSEPAAGQRAVAQVILNRVRHPAFPNTVCGVVYQGSERASGCQFSFACDGAMARVPAAALMLGGYVEPSIGMATHYHTFAVTPAWNRSLVMTAAIGAHFFHRWQGYWGTPAAFTQRYLGEEPVPGPHRAPSPLIAVVRAVPPVEAAPGATPDVARFAHGEPAVAPPPDAIDTLPESPVLDRWKDSGKPLR